MNDYDSILDITIEQNLEQLPPQDVVQAVSSWRHAFNRVLLGLLFITITLNFFYLNYICSTVGIILCLLGFRTLRKENIWFGFCYSICIVKIAFLIFTLFLNSTIYNDTFDNSRLSIIFMVFNLIISVALPFGLWRALVAVKTKIGSGKISASFALFVWYVLVGLLSFSDANTLISLLLLVCFVAILICLFKLSENFELIGYSVTPTLIKIPDILLSTLFLLAVVLSMSFGYIFFNSYPMDWKLKEQSDNKSVTDIKYDLRNKGFPSDMLNDICDSDILECANALSVYVSGIDDYPVNEGRQVVDITEQDGKTVYNHSIVYDVKELRITGVAVKLADNPVKWKIFYHFNWVVNPGFYGTESIQLWPCYSNSAWLNCSEITGMLLCDKNGKTYTSDYYRIYDKTYTADTIINGVQTSTDVFADFSFNFGGENHRGYLSHIVVSNKTGHLMYEMFNYTHQSSCFQFPVLTASQNRMRGPFNSTEAFTVVQNSIFVDEYS